MQVTVFTGFLGAGKTTIIMDLIANKQDEKIVLLKNEFGDVQVDSKLAQMQNIQVTEMMNGCLCCVSVGLMRNALLEIQQLYQPDRIIVETSGSAFPASIVLQLKELEPQGFVMDAIVTVIDCVNFRGYEDTSYTAKMQAQYTDLILLNKHELITEREYDELLDHVYELNEDTPKIKTDHGKVDPALVFGIGTRYAQGFDLGHQHREIDVIQIKQFNITKEKMEEFLSKCKKDSVFRVKGTFAWKEPEILNWAFGRCTWIPTTLSIDNQIVIMGQELGFILPLVKSSFDGQVEFIAA